MPKNSSFRRSSLLPGRRPEPKRRLRLDIKGDVDRLKAEKGRGKLVKDGEDIYAVIDSLIVCKNAKGTLYTEFPDLAKVYSVVTGFEVTAQQMS